MHPRFGPISNIFFHPAAAHAAYRQFVVSSWYGSHIWPVSDKKISLRKGLEARTWEFVSRYPLNSMMNLMHWSICTSVAVILEYTYVHLEPWGQVGWCWCWQMWGFNNLYIKQQSFVVHLSSMETWKLKQKVEIKTWKWVLVASFALVEHRECGGSLEPASRWWEIFWSILWTTWTIHQGGEWCFCGITASYPLWLAKKFKGITGRTSFIKKNHPQIPNFYHNQGEGMTRHAGSLHLKPQYKP